MPKQGSFCAKQRETMKIKLNEIYSLEGDLKHWKLIRKQQQTFVVEGYYSDLAILLNDFISASLRTSNSNSIQELLNYQKSLLHALNEAIRPLHIEVRPLKRDDKDD